MSNIAIKLTNVSKRYTIHHEKPTLVEKLVNGRDEEFWALKDINLTIKKKGGAASRQASSCLTN
jgi:ABC-type polysaccharide/polyol phosphate transport system ATPase subunit